MKTYLLLISALVFSGKLLAQNTQNLLGSWFLDEYTEISFAECESNESGNCVVVYSYYGDAFQNATVTLDKNTIRFSWVEPDYNYYDDEESAKEVVVMRSASFQLLSINEDALTLHPLDAEAVLYLDQIQQQGRIVVGRKERNSKFYRSYFTQVTKAKGKAKRAAVIDKWRKEEGLYVDTLVFRNELWFKEELNIEEPYIDSIWYSQMSVAKDSIFYYDFRVTVEDEYFFRQLHVPRLPNDGEISPENLTSDGGDSEIQFIPPVISDEVKYYDDEEVPTEEVEPTITDLVYMSGDGNYMGLIWSAWRTELNKNLAAYGPTRQYHEADSNYSCYGFVTQTCTKVRMRIFYKGTYKDLWLSDFLRYPILLNPFVDVFSSRAEYFDSFSLCNPARNFPFSFRKEN